MRFVFILVKSVLALDSQPTAGGGGEMERCVSTEKKELPHVQHQQAFSIYFFLEGLGFIEIVKGLGANNVLGETFWAKRFGRKFFFWNHILHLGLGAGQGWAGLGWAGGWAGAGWLAGLGWAGLGWAGLGLLGRKYAGLLGWAAGLLGWGGGGNLGWAGLGWAGVGWVGWCGLGCWAAGLGCVSNPETEIGLFENETEVGLFANGKLRLHRKKKLPDGQQQQAISIYFFLEGLGFRGL